MYKSCSRCGKIHPTTYNCNKGKVYRGGIERELRNTYDWVQKSLEIREKSNYLCAICRDEGRYTYNNLEVHHIVKVRENNNLLLDNYNLLCLCVEHHKKADKGEIDINYQLKLAKDREDGGDTQTPLP